MWCLWLWGFQPVPHRRRQGPVREPAAFLRQRAQAEQGPRPLTFHLPALNRLMKGLFEVVVEHFRGKWDELELPAKLQ